MKVQWYKLGCYGIFRWCVQYPVNLCNYAAAWWGCMGDFYRSLAKKQRSVIMFLKAGKSEQGLHKLPASSSNPLVIFRLL